ncbi:hypothetical protein [Citrobacter sp. S-77]|uniref:hypothetical protein n=1 Tax=Citrobacter sp. S-77 TaxID=1080067 RepID=UPI001186C054|nr:hypothetical protein [Citrobacter sp. S-77]
MLKKMLIASLSLSMFSSVSYAGGEPSSYYPSVAPISCVMSTSANPSYIWSNTEDCNKAVTSGYAKGVYYKGKFKYEDGSESAFNGFITPNQGYTPPHHAGKKLVAILDASASWAN